MDMLQQSFGTIHLPAKSNKRSLVYRFFDWCDSQEESRLGWLAVIIFGHGCIITPLTLGVVMLSGNNFIFWPWTIAAMGMSLVPNLAALPTKITIPIFFLSLLIDLVVIVNCTGIALNVL